MKLTSFEVEEFFKSVAEPVGQIRTSEDVVVSTVGRELYEKFFRSYTRKQWGLDPSELDASVTSRVPTRTNRDDRYFTDTSSAMPLHGYTRMFERMLNRQAEFAAQVASDIVGRERVDAAVPPVMGAEDFSFMLEARPGAFIFVGNGDSAGLHHPAYNFNDELIPFGTSYWVKLVETALRG